MSSMHDGFILLEDGTVFTGTLFGDTDRAREGVSGEACFNTSLSGYQEIITDPSYYNQIVTFTATMIGNYGINKEDFESDRVYLSGIVCREYVDRYSNHRAYTSLNNYLKEQGKVGISSVDTRALTLHIRNAGAQNSVIFAGDVSPDNIEKAKAVLAAFPGLVGRDLVKEVTCKEAYTPSAERTQLNDWPERDGKPVVSGKSLAVIDCGVKYNILRELYRCGFDLKVFPASTSWADIKDYDAYFISNGPGDPEPVSYVIDTARSIIESGKPLFGICLGHQLISQALGATTYKMKFGHRGGNQPVMDSQDNRVQITSQNHGFAVNYPEDGSFVTSQVNLNDETLEGLTLEGKPVMAVQYHPEAAPGPRDARVLFDRFGALCSK